MSDFKFLSPKNNKENQSTPGSSKRKGSPITPYLCNINGSNNSQSLIRNLLTKKFRCVVSEDILNEDNTTPSEFASFSPDFAGKFFPKDINVSKDQLLAHDKLYRQYRYYHAGRDEILLKESIAPSPLEGSGIKCSIQSTVSNTDSDCIVAESPINFKWNRRKYQTENVDMSSYEMSMIDDETDDEFIPERHLESTQIFDYSQRLTDNSSMRVLSVINRTFDCPPIGKQRNLNSLCSDVSFTSNENDVNLMSPILPFDQSFEHNSSLDMSIESDSRIGKLNLRCTENSPYHRWSPGMRVDNKNFPNDISPINMFKDNCFTQTENNIVSSPLCMSDIQLSPILPHSGTD